MAKFTAPLPKIIGIDLSEGNANAAALVNGQPVILPQTPGTHSGKVSLADTLRLRKSEAESYLRQSVTQAVVSVPTRYSESVRQAIRDAGRLAGLEIKRIINAPGAIALTYYRQCPGTEEDLVVYTLERNSCSAAVLDISSGVIETLSAEGVVFDNPFAEDMMDAAMEPVRQALAAADAIREHQKLTGHKPYQRKHLLLAGLGRTSPIRKAISPIVGEHVTMFKSPDGCAAQGAAIMGGVMTGEVQDTLLLDVTVRSLGLLTRDGFSEVVQPGTCFPLQKAQLFTTTEHNQTALELHVQQGTGKDATVLWRYRIENIPPAPKGKPQIEIRFNCDANGIWSITAKDADHGQELTLTPIGRSQSNDLLPVPYDEEAAKNAVLPPPPPPPPEKPKEPEAPKPAQILSPQLLIERWELGHAKGVSDTLVSLFPVYDNLERAMKQPTIDDAYKKGVEMTLKGMEKAFRDLGVEAYGNPGEPFDPKLHTAVVHEENQSVGSNVITQVFQKGFKLGEKIVRFAMVQVAN